MNERWRHRDRPYDDRRERSYDDHRGWNTVKSERTPAPRCEQSDRSQVTDYNQKQRTSYIKEEFKWISYLDNGVFLFLTVFDVLLCYFAGEQSIIADGVEYVWSQENTVQFVRNGSVYRFILTTIGDYVFYTYEIEQQELQGAAPLGERFAYFELFVTESMFYLVDRDVSMFYAIPIAHKHHFIMNDTLIFVGGREVCCYYVEKGIAIMQGLFLLDANVLGAVVDRYGTISAITDLSRYTFMEELK